MQRSKFQEIVNLGNRITIDFTPRELSNAKPIHLRDTPTRISSAADVMTPKDENGKRWATTMCHAWFVWETGKEATAPIIKWI